MKDLIIQQIKKLGVNSGDVLVVTADLLKVGFFQQNSLVTYQSWIEIIKSVVGEKGTVVIPAYTPFFSKFNIDPNIIFFSSCVTNSGSLSLAFSKSEGIIRSSHPTNSCYAFGPDAEYILEGHDEMSTSYLPYQRVIELGGKQLFLGCISDIKQGPMSIHAVQENLGLTKKSWQSGLFQTFYIDKNGEKKLFTRFDFGGCTAFGYKTLGHHVILNAIEFGPVGKSNSALIDCKKSFEIILKLYQNEPDYLRCDNKYCPDCYGNKFVTRYKFLIKSLLKRVLTSQHRTF